MRRLAALAMIFFSWILIGTAHSQDWQWQNPLPQGNWLNDVMFVNETTGWAVGDRGTIIHTTDGGQSWTWQESGVSSSLEAVYFRDDMLGFVIGGESG